MADGAPRVIPTVPLASRGVDAVASPPRRAAPPQSATGREPLLYTADMHSIPAQPSPAERHRTEEAVTPVAPSEGGDGYIRFHAASTSTMPSGNAASCGGGS